jgi:nucleolar protein 9
VACICARNPCSKKKKGVKRAKEAAKEAAKHSKVDAATLEYWRRVETTLAADEFDGAEERGLFITNVLSVLDGSEAALARDQQVSRVIEKLLGAASGFQIRVFMDRLAGRYAEMARDRIASHVLQRLLDLLPRVIMGQAEEAEAEAGEGDEGELPGAEALFLSMVDELVC